MYVNNFIDLVINKSFHYKRQLFKREHIIIYTLVAIAQETLHCIVHSIAFFIIIHYILIAVCKLNYIILCIINIKLHYNTHYITMVFCNLHCIYNTVRMYCRMHIWCYIHMT